MKNRFELFEGQEKFTAHFYSLLTKKLSSYDEINHSIKAFQLIRINGKTVGLKECDELGINLFDDNGNWNKEAALLMDEFDFLLERVNEMLYPNILEKKNTLSDKEKLILCALVHEIQSYLNTTYLCNKPQDIESAQKIREQIYEAAHKAVARKIPSLASIIAQSTEDQTNHDDCHCLIF